MLCHAHGIQGYGSLNAKVLICGIAPARDEMKTKKPFTGASGKLLNSLLQACGFEREDVYTSNLVCWRTMEANNRTNRDPYPKEIASCASRLDQEIKTIKPKLIVGLGDLVAQQFIPKRTYSRGALHWLDKYNCYFMHTYHPAAALYESSDTKDDYKICNALASDFSRISDAVNLPRFEEPKYTIADHETGQGLLNSLAGHYAALDVETGKDDDDVSITDINILCLSISSAFGNYIFPGHLIDELEWPDNIKWIMHNGLYDAQVMLNKGIRLIIAEDTMLMHYSINENELHGLKSLSHAYLGAPFYEDKIKPYYKQGLQHAPVQTLYQYNTYDSYCTLRLFDLFLGLQDEEDVRGFYAKILIPSVNVFVEIQHRGMRISTDAMRELLRLWYPELEALNKELDVESGGINLASPKQLSNYLYNVLKLPGGPSTDKIALKALEDKHPFPAKLQRQRRLTRMVNQYLVGIYHEMQKNNLIHSVIKLHGTVTGRPSYTNPPSQTIPGPNSIGNEFGRIKEIFVPWDADHTLCEADYTKAEIYVASAHAQDEQLLHDLDNTDFHRRAAALIFNKDDDDVTGPERTDGKRWNFGIFYGMDENGAAYRFGISKAVAKEWIRVFFNYYHKFAAWRLEQKRKIQQLGEVVSFHGRKRRFPLILSYKMLQRAWRQAINDPIQADSVDNLLLSLIELHYKLKQYDSYILLEVHDSIIFDLNRKHLDITISLIAETMTKSKHPQMPRIPVEIKLGESWGNMKAVEIKEAVAV